ncbi:hypothetical protein KXW39_008486 [Aspergillus fumigatus]|nr:hypothetical protein KXX17_009278 [Aspergillus fumigatus]KAH1626797.1 hypothetical protein KXX21_003994 [Aspergillus fumigatus]KAH3306728.1 hypothetical protein KXV87_008685 [Aspergillus fumigatus]KAH3442567.1 hypothetical protein KXW39_008486 [Aspergillus fumigatus]
MAKKAKNGGNPILRKAIREEIRSCYEQNRPIKREAIRAKYSKKHPDLIDYIKTIVNDYADYLESKLKTDTSQGSKGPSPTSAAQPSTRGNNTPAESQVKSRTSRTVSSASSSQLKSNVHHRISGVSDVGLNCLKVVDSASNISSEDIDNALLQDFKEHLAGVPDNGTYIRAPSAVPPLELQKQFLASSEAKDDSIKDSIPTEQAALVSSALENCGYRMPPQFALLGEISQSGKSKELADPRIMLNTNVPFSAFVCGLQGSGKSHTTSCMIENCSLRMASLGSLTRSISTLVLQFNEYSSSVSSQPSEAAFLATVMPEYSQQHRIPLRVLVSPTNFHNLKRMYSQIPNVEVQAYRIQPRHLNISMMLLLMSVSQNDSMPLYMAQVTRVLREMAMESGGCFDYLDFRERLSALRLDRVQTPFLHQRLDLLDSYLDLTGQATSDYFVDGGVTILDLSCPFVDQNTACILFRIAIDLFLSAHPSRGKMIVADEAHKYMTESPSAKELVQTFLSIIRQQRHCGVRTVICTQEPTVSPKLIELSSIIVIHRFTSPEWYKVIQKHVPMDTREVGSSEDGVPSGLCQIASLRTGEAIIFAPSAHLIGEKDMVLDTRHRTFRMLIRKRVTWDGGRTVICIR